MTQVNITFAEITPHVLLDVMFMNIFTKTHQKQESRDIKVKLQLVSRPNVDSTRETLNNCMVEP